MDVEIITVGYEILDGDVLDTNSNWMAKQIASTGNHLRRITIVEDKVEVIASCLGEALERTPDLILISGGLGPTRDDLTLQGVAKGLGLPLVEDPRAMEMIRRKYAAMHPETPPGEILTEPRRKMAMIPEGSDPLSNPVGTAPAVRLNYCKSTIICLPGVPDEIKAIFRESVIPFLKPQEKEPTVQVIVEGIGESLLAPFLNELMPNYGVEIRSYPGKGRIRVKIIGRRCKDAASRLRSALEGRAKVNPLD